VRPIHAQLEPLVQHLAAKHDWEQICRVLESFENTHQLTQLQDWKAIHKALSWIPLRQIVIIDGLCTWFVSSLIALRYFDAIAALPQSQNPVILNAQGWVLLQNCAFLEAQTLLESATPQPTIRLEVFRLKNLAQIYFALGKDWYQGFVNAKTLAKARDRGLCLIDEATCYDRTGDTATARTLWLEVLPLFKSDPYHLAWLRYNLGISSAKDLIPDAERHFHELQRLAQKPDLKAWQSRAWSGLGVTHRVRGEWERAIYAYTRAQTIALEPDDHIEATSSLALTLRLADRIPEALEVLALSPHQSPALAVQQAACYLAAQDPRRATTILETLQPQTAADHIRAAYCRAELGRLAPELNAILHHLEPVPPTNLIAREEFTYWHALRQILCAINRPTPIPLEYTTSLAVSVYALGGFRVLVNARSIHLEPRCAEVLLLLLERGGAASLSSLAALVFPDARPSSAQSNTRRLLVQLRDAFSWAGVVVLDNKTITLSPAAQWFYDIAEARAKGYAHAEFLPGMDKPWMLEVAAGVRLLGRKGEN
jgi:tetratricopeptide (TPR) repeat protein